MIPVQPPIAGHSQLPEPPESEPPPCWPQEKTPQNPRAAPALMFIVFFVLGVPGHHLCLHPQHCARLGAPLLPAPPRFPWQAQSSPCLSSHLVLFFLWRQDICTFMSLYVLSLAPLLQTFTYLARAPGTRSKTYIYGISHFKNCSC